MIGIAKESEPKALLSDIVWSHWRTAISSPRDDKGGHNLVALLLGLLVGSLFRICVNARL